MSKRFICFIIFVYISLPIELFGHNYAVTNIEMVYNFNKKRLEIIITLPKEPLYEELCEVYPNYKSKINLQIDTFDKFHTDMLSYYINTNLKIGVNKPKPNELKILGIKNTSQSIFFHITIDGLFDFFELWLKVTFLNLSHPNVINYFYLSGESISEKSIEFTKELTTYKHVLK